MENKQMEIAKEQIKKEIEILETALLFRTRHELKVHINEQKKLANKYFGCDYEIAELVTVDNNGFNAQNNGHGFGYRPNGNNYQNNGFNRAYNGFNKSYQTNYQPQQQFRPQPQYQPCQATEHKHWNKDYEIEETGIVHTYAKYTTAERPFDYLDAIKVGDKIKYYDKNEGRIIYSMVVNIVKKEKTTGFPLIIFYMKNNTSITIEDFR